MLTQKLSVEARDGGASRLVGPRVEVIQPGSTRAANAGRVGPAKSLDRRLRRQRRRARASLRSRAGWSVAVW